MERAKLESKALDIMCKVANGQRLEDLAELKLWNGRKGTVLMERYLSRCPKLPECKEQFRRLTEDILKQSAEFPSLADHDKRRAHTLEQNGVLYGMIMEARTHGISIVKIPPGLRPNYHPPEEKAQQLVRSVHGFMKSYVEQGRMLDWSKPLYRNMQEASIDKAQLLMKRYQKRLKMNKEIYPELMWEDLRLTLSDHQQEWGVFDETLTCSAATSGPEDPSENRY